MWPWMLIVGCISAPGTPAFLVAVDALPHAPPARYFLPENDPRDCAWPTCGGWFMDPPNRGEILCADGTQSAQCYVAELGTERLGLDDAERARFDVALGEGRLLLEGRMVVAEQDGRPLVRFEVVQAWEGQTGGDPAGGWAIVKENGRQCLVAPCAHLDEGLLNRNLGAVIADLDFAPSGADAQQVTAAWEATLDEGVIVAGRRYWVTGAGGVAQARTVTEFYMPLGP